MNNVLSKKYTKKQLVEYCKYNHINKVSKFSKDQLKEYIVKYVYFNFLKNNHCNYSECIIKKFRETKEYYETVNSSIEGNTEGNTEENTEGNIYGLNECNEYQLISTISDKMKEMQLKKQNNCDKSEIKGLSIQLYKLKKEYFSLTNSKWTHDLVNLNFDPRPSNNCINETINTIKNNNNIGNIQFDEINNSRYDNLYRMFKEYRYSLDKSLGDNNEQILFHGTEKENIDSIIEHDFALINTVSNGQLYGNGIYFTNSIQKAMFYSKKDKDKKYVLMCNVHIGNTVKGRHSMNMLSKESDTAVDNIDSPIQFIKKKNNQYTFLGVLTIDVNNDTMELNHSISVHNKCNRFSKPTFAEIIFINHNSVLYNKLNHNYSLKAKYENLCTINKYIKSNREFNQYIKGNKFSTNTSTHKNKTQSIKGTDLLKLVGINYNDTTKIRTHKGAIFLTGFVSPDNNGDNKFSIIDVFKVFRNNETIQLT